MKSFSMSFACLLENHPIYLQTVELPRKERQHMNRKDEDKFVDQEKTQKKKYYDEGMYFYGASDSDGAEDV